MSNFILMQTINFIKVASDRGIIIGAIIFFSIVLSIIMASILGRNKISRYDLASASIEKKRKIFKKTAGKMNFSKDHVIFMEKLASKYNLDSPLPILTNQRIFSNILKSEIAELDNVSDKAAENEKMMIFDIKQKLDMTQLTAKEITTTKNLHKGTDISLQCEEGNLSYPTRIAANLKNALVVKMPVIQGTDKFIKWKKRQPLAVSFRKNNNSYEFKTKITGFTKIKDEMCIGLQHSNSIVKKINRKFFRKEINKLCYFFSIAIQESGYAWKKKKQAVISDPKGKLGTIIEISSGGCSIKSKTFLQAGTLIKIEFEIKKGKTIFVLGKVKKTNKEEGVFIMHIQFTKISKITLNNINSFIYGT